MSIAGLTSNCNVDNVQFKANVDKTKETSLLKQDAPTDSFEFEHLHNGAPLSKEDKQELVHSARQKAAGFAVFGAGFSTLYYGLRSDKTVAQKYNLALKEDSKLIKTIKREQTLCTLPALIPGLGIIPGVVSYVYNKNADSSKINVEDV